MLLVNSGYGLFGQMPGNLLLASGWGTPLGHVTDRGFAQPHVSPGLIPPDTSCPDSAAVRPTSPSRRAIPAAASENRQQPFLEGVVKGGAETRMLPVERLEGHPDQCQWKPSTQSIVVDQESLEAENTELRRKGARQMVGSKSEIPQTSKIAQFPRNRACQFVGVQVEISEVRKAAQIGRDGATHQVLAEIQVLKVRRCAQIGRDGAAHQVLAEIQVLKARQYADPGWDRTVQSVVGKPEPGDVPVGVRGHTVPKLERCGRPPVGSVGPADFGRPESR